LTSSFIFIGSIVISLCLFLNTLNISSANACPIVLTPLKSKNITLNFSILDKILLAIERDIRCSPKYSSAK